MVLSSALSSAVESWTAADAAPQRLAPAQMLDAAPLFPDLQIDLAEVWLSRALLRPAPAIWPVRPA
ncbi:hypothetical protein [Synechococcus sp. 1G10]|uniref:hypothetical protein n=1 Tax=Synechococcus sp. 1G10 TaxID=2025605 RepID=UPI000B994D8B|nr:hypothetical protein [Synechococcus sp. 1G10]